MVNRDLIRIKVVQLTYAYYQNGERNIDKAEKEVKKEVEKTEKAKNEKGEKPQNKQLPKTSAVK